MTDNNQGLQKRVDEVNTDRIIPKGSGDLTIICDLFDVVAKYKKLINDLSTALKAEQAKSAKYEKALKTIAEWQSSSDSPDAISAANTAIEALGDDYEK